MSASSRFVIPASLILFVLLALTIIPIPTQALITCADGSISIFSSDKCPTGVRPHDIRATQIAAGPAALVIGGIEAGVYIVGGRAIATPALFANGLRIVGAMAGLSVGVAGSAAQNQPQVMNPSNLTPRQLQAQKDTQAVPVSAPPTAAPAPASVSSAPQPTSQTISLCSTEAGNSSQGNNSYTYNSCIQRYSARFSDDRSYFVQDTGGTAPSVAPAATPAPAFVGPPVPAYPGASISMDTLQQLAKDKCKSWGSSSAICEADYIKTFQDDIRENVSPATAPAAVSPTGPTQVTGLIDGKVTPDDIKRIGENCRNEEDLDTCMRRTIASWQGGNLDGNDIEKINQYIAQGAPTPASTSDAPTGEMGPFISNYQRAVRYCDGTGYISEADINQCQIDVEHRLDIGESMVAPAVNLGQIAPQSDISRITQPCANRAGNGDCLDQSNPTYCLPSILSIFNGSWNNCANGVQGAEQPHASVQEGPTAQQPPAPVEKITTFFPAQTPVAQSCISYAANGDCTGYLQPATGLLKSFQDSVSNFFSSGSQTAPVQQISTQASGWGATPAPSVSRYDKGGELSGYIIPRFSGPAGQATGPVQSSEPAQPAAQEVAPSTESAQTPTDIVDQENNPQNTIQQGYTETVIPFYGNFGGDGANLDELLQQPDSLQMFDNGTSNLNGVLIDWSLMYGKPTRQFSAAEPSNPLQNQSLAASAFGALVPIITDTRN